MYLSLIMSETWAINVSHSSSTELYCILYWNMHILYTSLIQNFFWVVTITFIWHVLKIKSWIYTMLLIIWRPQKLVILAVRNRCKARLSFVALIRSITASGHGNMELKDVIFFLTVILTSKLNSNIKTTNLEKRENDPFEFMTTLTF